MTGPTAPIDRQSTEEAARSWLPAAILLALLSAVWTWWACKDGGYFEAVMYPGLVVLCAGVLLIVQRRRPRGLQLELPTPAKLAIWSLAGLAAWSALSAVWSPSPEIALADAQRIAGYSVAFALGIWLRALLGHRIHLAMAPLAIAGLAAGVLAAVVLLTGDDPGRYLDNGTLEYPLGYRNANAAFFAIAVWPAVGLAATRELDWRLRALSLATATLCLELSALSESRGATIAGVVALAVYVVVSRDRARAVGWLALAIVPALVVLPALTDLYEAARNLPADQTIDEFHAAGRATVLGAGLALVIAAISAFAGRRFQVSPTTVERANRAVAAGAVAVVLAGAVGFVVATGDPVDWIDERVDEFRNERSPDTSQASSRFGVNAGSERYDLWRVAVADSGEDPLLGDGGGGFYYSYLRQRGENGLESVHDAHSVELEILSELGIPGLALFAIAIGGAGVGAVRSRRLGPSAAALSAGALTAGSYWLAHTSIDWFWPYPAVTAPVLALLGSACAPAVLSSGGSRPSIGRRLAVIGAVVLAVSVVPPYLSQRYVDDAFVAWPDDPARAERDLDRASTLNPLSVEPLLARGAIAQARGDPEQAIAAFQDAAEDRPEEWATHYLLARLYREEGKSGLARSELEVAAELNPRSARVEALRQDLRAPQ